MIPVDLNHERSWHAALPVAVRLASLDKARLHLVTIVPDFGTSMVGTFFPEDFEKQALEKARAELEAFAKDHVPEGIDHACHIGHGTIYVQLLAMAKELAADLIVMGAHRPGLEGYLIGPNAARVVRHAPVSVMVVRE